MSKNFTFLARLFFALFAIVAGSHAVSAQYTLTGTWTANDYSDWNRNRKDGDEKKEAEKREANKDKVQLNFRYQHAGGGTNNQGSGYAYSDLQGLTRAQVESANSINVTFRIQREAGTIECTGTFENGKGGGTFRFTGNQQFVSAMRQRGFDFERPSKNNRENDVASRLFSATTVNVTTAIADDVKSNFPNSDIDDLFKATIFKIDSAFMREMTATGFPNLGMEELVKARIFKIDAAFVREMKDTGFPNLSMEHLVKARIFKIDAAFVRSAAQMNFKDRDFEDLVKLSIHKITPEFMREMQAAGFSNITPEEATKLKIFKVTPEFIREVKAEGLSNLSVEQATKLKIFKIDAAFIRQAKAENVPLNVETLVQKRIGVYGRRSQREWQ